MVKEIQVEESKPKTYQDEDGFEVFEIDDKGSEIKGKNWYTGPTMVVDTNTKKKLRPNDTVTVRYADGKIVVDTKYKKVKEDVESGKCVVI